MNATELKTLLEKEFPVDATGWNKATDEVRDMSREARLILQLDERHAVDFDSIRSPSEWNRIGIQSILDFYNMMGEDMKQEYIAKMCTWFPRMFSKYSGYVSYET